MLPGLASFRHSAILFTFGTTSRLPRCPFLDARGLPANLRSTGTVVCFQAACQAHTPARVQKNQRRDAPITGRAIMSRHRAEDFLLELESRHDSCHVHSTYRTRVAGAAKDLRHDSRSGARLDGQSDLTRTSSKRKSMCRKQSNPRDRAKGPGGLIHSPRLVGLLVRVPCFIDDEAWRKGNHPMLVPEKSACQIDQDEQGARLERVGWVPPMTHLLYKGTALLGCAAVVSSLLLRVHSSRSEGHDRTEECGIDGARFRCAGGVPSFIADLRLLPLTFVELLILDPSLPVSKSPTSRSRRLLSGRVPASC